MTRLQGATANSAGSNMAEKTQQAQASDFDYACMVDSASTVGLSHVPPPSYKSHVGGNVERVHLAKVLAWAFVATITVVGVVIVLSLHIAYTNQCTCDQNDRLQPAAAALIQDLASAGSSDTPVKTGTPPPPASATRGKVIPLKLQFDPLPMEMMRRNQKAQINCIVEKKKASEVIAHDPKLIMTPYGNMTTEPRLVHLTGERMVFTCLSGTQMNPRQAKWPRGGPGPQGPPVIVQGPPDMQGPPAAFIMSRPRRSAPAEKQCDCNCAC